MDTATALRRTTFLLAPAILASYVTWGCASDEKLITTKIQYELEACQRAEGETHEVQFEIGDPYVMVKDLCKGDVTDIVITEQINGNAKVGPYQFTLRKNTTDQRWVITRITWPELDQARSIMTFDTISDSDLSKADELLAKAEQQAPQLDEIPMTRLKIKLMQRKRTNKKGEKDRSGLGVAEDYFATATKAAGDRSDHDLELALRLQVVSYLANFHQLAEDSSTPNESAAEWELGAIKAVKNEAEEAKKKGDDKLYKEKLAEIATLEKEMPENAARREKDAEEMKVLAGQLKKRLCAEIAKAKAVPAKDDDLLSELGSHASACS